MNFDRIVSALFVLALACNSEDADPLPADEGADGSDEHADHGTDHGTSAGEHGTSTSSTSDDGPADTTSGPAESTGADSESSTGAATMDTWENWALPEFFTPYCIECHPGQSPRDFTMYGVVVDNVEHIRCGVAPQMLADCTDHIEPGHLPIGDGPYPSDDERWRLVDWIDAGLPMD